MPISSIITQPAANELKSAYRPIIVVCEATQTSPTSDANYVPPVVYCDVYVDGVYYKSLAKMQPTNKPVYNTTPARYEFDIQDACQEILRPVLPINGRITLQQALTVAKKIKCKMRASSIDVNGFTAVEGAIPTQGTGNNDPVSGDGTETNEFVVVNAVLQHEDNQQLATHLASFKSGTWDANAWPLTHRPSKLQIGKRDSDQFPFITTDKTPSCVRIRYRLKGENFFRTRNSCSTACEGVQLTVDMTLTDPVETIPWLERWSITGTAPFELINVVKPTWMFITILEETPGNWVIQFAGTPTEAAEDVIVSFDVTNCDNATVVHWEDNIDVLPLGSRNFKVVNGSENFIIVDVQPDSFYTINVGNFPLIPGPGDACGGDHINANIALAVEIDIQDDVPSSSTLKLFVNNAEIEAMPVTASGIYTFSAYNFLLADEILVGLDYL